MSIRDGVIVVDKPSGWTSHDVVNKLRRLTGTKKIGHLGTLDPMATGILPLVVGKATRLAQFFQKSEKVYEATIRFGFSTDTYDADGLPTSNAVDISINCERLQNALEEFRGRISQVPPPVSAKKIGGVPAYKLARQNVAVELKPVHVEIFCIEVRRCEGNEAEISIHCSAGTYVRSIAHGLGVAFGCGAHLSALRRTASGGFALDMAQTIEQLTERAAAGTLDDAVIPAAQLLPEFPSELVDAGTAGFIRQGRDFQVSPFRQRDSRYVKAVTYEGDLVAIGEAKLPHVYHPVLVL